jgi:NADPH:quinone reductase
MRAAIYESAGGSEVLQVRDVPTPEPGPGEVRVRIAVAGVNPTDWKSLRRAGPVEGPFAVPCQDGAGTIDAVGAGVDHARVGQRVWLLLAADGSRWGTAAEYSVVPADRAIPLPEEATFELGASLGVPAVTAWHCLRSDGPLDGLTVLVAGGAGAVGHAAIQLARFENAARVIATISSAPKAEIARAAGAHVTVNYREHDAAEKIRAAATGGVDRFVEVALDANLELDLTVAAPHAVIASYAAAGDDAAEVPIRRLMMANIVLRFMLLYTITPVQLQTAIERVSAAVSEGALTTPPLHRFPLTETASAFAAVEQGVVGKVLIEPV